MSRSAAPLVIAAVAAAVFAVEAKAQASAPATGSVTILDPSTLAQDSVLALAPVQRPSGGAAITSQALGARYSVSGVAGDTFTVDMPRTVRMVRSGGAEEVLIRIAPSGSTGALGGTYGSRAQGSFGVQGAVSVSGAAKAGAYEGTFPVILTLQ